MNEAKDIVTGETKCKCGLPKDDPIHSYSTEWQKSHTFDDANPSQLDRAGLESQERYLLPRVKLIPLQSTWTCPTCQRQNTYREGVVSDPQNQCKACGTKVVIGAVRRSTAAPSVESTWDEAIRIVEGSRCPPQFRRLWQSGYSHAQNDVVAALKIAKARSLAAKDTEK